MGKIFYKDGYKYQLYQPYNHKLPDDFFSTKEFYCDFIGYSKKHNSIYVDKGYSWDGASGGAVDSKDIMRASLVHDALYQSIRMGYMPESMRQLADKEFKRVMIEDGVSWFRANYCYLAVKLFGANSAKNGERKEVLSAP